MKKLMIYIPYQGNENKNPIRISLIFSAYANFTADKTIEFVKLFRSKGTFSYEIDEQRVEDFKRELDELEIIYKIE